ncbi:MAG: hypothetical protein H6558_21650 [Lewinellaceae bacterium]|nr:hypothetical protein [Lewinellaceae bacterium]MCB9295703.1 hypothetical protein [Lewinellaceae bacterium]
MKFLKNFFFLALAATALTFVGCNKDDEEPHMHGDNEITIRILEPGADEVIADASDVHIHIEIEASDENHEVEIVLHPEGDVNDKIIDFGKHEHSKVITFEQDVDLSSYPSGTGFHLEVEACKDHDCAEKEFADVEFSIQ